MRCLHHQEPRGNLNWWKAMVAEYHEVGLGEVYLMTAL
jgi:hypothetical protein